MMIKIEGYDFSTCVVAQSYNVNRVDVYKDWTDANYKLHRAVVRSKIKGSMTLHMRDADFTIAFQEVIAGKVGSDPFYRLHVDVTNTGEENVAVTAVMTASPVHKAAGEDDMLEEFQLTFEEA